MKPNDMKGETTPEEFFTALRSVNSLREHVVIIGTGAMALQGADVTPGDLDLFVPESVIASVTDALPEAIVHRSHAPAITIETPLAYSIDFYTGITTGRSFPFIRARSDRIAVDGDVWHVTSLVDLEEMLVAAARPKDAPRLDAVRRRLRQTGANRTQQNHSI